jgi:glycine dehydrogenase
VILRNILENPAWYTAYTFTRRRSAKAAGMEALVNFQTMVADLTGMPMANAPMLTKLYRGRRSHDAGHARGQVQP